MHASSNQARVPFEAISWATGDIPGMNREGPKVQVAHVDREHKSQLSSISIVYE